MELGLVDQEGFADRLRVFPERMGGGLVDEEQGGPVPHCIVRLEEASLQQSHAKRFEVARADRIDLDETEVSRITWNGHAAKEHASRQRPDADSGTRANARRPGRRQKLARDYSRWGPE